MFFDSKYLLSIAVVLLMMGGGIAFTHQFACGEVYAFSCQVAPTSGELSKQLAENYYTYSEQTLALAREQDKTVVLYFWAPWCVSCTSLDSELEDEQARVPEDLTVLRINYDTAGELKKQYNIVTQHTFVQIDDNGNPVTSWVGGDIENFEKYLKR